MTDKKTIIVPRQTKYVGLLGYKLELVLQQIVNVHHSGIIGTKIFDQV